MDGPADTQHAMPSSSEETEMTGDPDPRQGPLKRLLKALASPVRNYIVGALDGRQHQMAQRLQENEESLNRLTNIEPLVEEHTRFLEKLGSIQETTTGHIEALENARITAIDDINMLREDAERARNHLAALQNQCSALQKTVEEHAIRGDRFENLWADLHRDMTALAEAFSRLESD